MCLKGRWISRERALEIPIPGSSQVPRGVIDRSVRLLQEAKFPVILAGGEVKWSGAVRDLVELAEALEIPGTTNRDHPDAFPNRHPLGVGMIGKGRGEAGNRVMKSADLILALGVKFDYQSTRYNFDIIPRKAKIVHVSINPEEVGRIYPTERGSSAMSVRSLRR